VAAQHRGGVDPLLVALDGLRPLGRVGGAEVGLAVDHDQHARDALVGGPLPELLQIGLVAGLVVEELVDVLDRVDAEVLAGHAREVEVGAGRAAGAEQVLVQRPLGQRDLEVADAAGAGRPGDLLRPRPGRGPADAQRRGPDQGAFEELPAVQIRSDVHDCLLPARR